MDTNGTGPQGEWPEAPMGAFPDIAAFVGYVIGERPELAEHRDMLYRLVGMSARVGFVEGEKALRARFLPVRFEKEAIGVARLEGAEAEALLASFGLSSDDEAGPNGRGNGT